MTEPFRPDDELVSAVLDGEATADERARVEADPELRARLAEFTAVHDRVAEVPDPAREADRDRVVTAAVAERHRREEVVSLLHRRRDPRRFLAVAAAVLVVLLAAGFLVGQLGGGDRNDRLAGRGESGGDGSGSGGGAGGSTYSVDEEAAEGGMATGAPDQLLELDEVLRADLGAVADEAELRQSLQAAAATRDEDDANSTTTTAASADFAEAERDCQALLDESDPGLSGVLVRATAVYDGTPAVVHVFATTDGDRRVIVVTADSCMTLVTFTL